MSDPSAPRASMPLGRAVTARFEPMHARRRTRIALDHRAGVVARKSVRFGLLNGRSILARRVMGQNVSAQVSGTNLLPVGMQLDLWLAVAEQERTRMRPTPSRLEQSMQAAQRRVMRSAARGLAAEAAAAGPRGLPRATSRGRLSPAGVDTGPSSATHRMVTEAAFVANPDEVRAAGPMLGRRDLARAVARRSTVGPPSPSTGGGRARRSAQASGPGRQVGATRPDADAVIARLANASSSPTSSSAAAGRDANSDPAADGGRVSNAPAEMSMPRALSLPPHAQYGESDLDAFVPWQPLPRPGAVARRGALASELRRAPREVRGSTWAAPVATSGLVVAPTIEAASLLTSARASDARTPTAQPDRMRSASGTARAATIADRGVAPTRQASAVVARAAVPAARFGPAVPASLLRARVLRAAPASVAGARVVGRVTRQASPSAIRPSSFVTPPVSTVDRHGVASRRVSIGDPGRATAYARAQSSVSPSRAAMPVLRSMADAVQRVTRTTERSAIDPTDASGRSISPSTSHTAAANAAAAAIDATRSAAAGSAIAGATTSVGGLPLSSSAAPTMATPMSIPTTAGLPMSTSAAATAATPVSMPSRLGEAPVPSLPMAAAFAQRAVTDRAQPLMPIAARARAAQEIRRSSLGRVTTIASATQPTGPRSRFGRNIAPVTSQPPAFATPVAHFRPASASASSGSVPSVASVGGAAGGVVARRESASARSSAAGTPLGSMPRSISAPNAMRANATTPTNASVSADENPSAPATRHEIRRSIAAPETAAPMTPAAAMMQPPTIPGVAAASTGARFLAALREAPADPIRPVPAAYAPLARAIAGPKPVAVRAGAATTRALRRVGKRAATVDNVVHLDASPVVSLPSTEVFAHELVHAARPSPIPRFFDDDHHSPEEDLARATGHLMRAVQPASIAGPAADTIRRMQSNDGRTPTFGTAGMVVGASGGLMGALAASSPGAGAPPPPSPSPSAAPTAGTIRRSPASRPAAERKTRSSSSTSRSNPSSAVVRRSSSSGGSSSSGLASSPSTTIFRSAVGSNVVRRESTGGGDNSVFGLAKPDDNNNTGGGSSLVGLTSASGSPGHSADKLSNSNSPADNELIERIIDAIEERVIAELERRGRRHHPGVF